MPRNYRKRASKPRRRVARRRMPLMRSPRNTMPTFTETWAAAPITTSGTTVGGQLVLTGTSIPQMADYSALYRQFRILRCQWILMPRFQSIDPNTLNYNSSISAPTTNNGRFVYAINDTGGLVNNPASELEVLQDNGCKILSSTRHSPIKISHKPVPQLNVSSTALFNVYMNKKDQWLNTDSPGNNGSGTGVTHGSVTYFLTVPGTTGSATIFDVYCKTTVQFKDPA